jgi:hypothetical protein
VRYGRDDRQTEGYRYENEVTGMAGRREEVTGVAGHRREVTGRLGYSEEMNRRPNYERSENGSPERYRGNSWMGSGMDRGTPGSRSPLPQRPPRYDERRDESYGSKERADRDYRSPVGISRDEGSPVRRWSGRQSYEPHSDNEDSGYGGIWGQSRGRNPYMMTNRAWPLFDPDKHRWDEFKARTVLKTLRMGADERDVSTNLADVLPGEAVIYLENRGIAGRSLNTVL